MCKKMFTLTIAALAVLATANLAQAQIVKKFSSNSQTVINQNAGSSTIISPSGIVQQSGFQNTAVDSRSNFAGMTNLPSIQLADKAKHFVMFDEPKWFVDRVKKYLKQ